MMLKEFLASAKEIMTELNGLLKVLVSTVGLALVAFSVYKQLSTVETLTPATVVETVCGDQVIEDLSIAAGLADPVTAAIVQNLLLECKKVKPTELDPALPVTPEPTTTETPVVEKAGYTLLNVYTGR